MNELIEKIEKINNERFSDKQGRSFISVSKLETYVTEPFDKEKQAQSCARKGLSDPNYKYARMTAEQIIQAWDDKAAESRQYGMWLDEFAEQTFTGTDKTMKLWKLDHNFGTDSRLTSNCNGLTEFWTDLQKMGFSYVGREITIYCQSTAELEKSDLPFDSDETVPDNVVVGRIDALFKNNNNGKLFIVDWKTTDDIKTTAFRNNKMKGPAHNWEDCDMGKYTIQLHIYKNALAHTYELTTEDNIAVCVCNLLREPDEQTGKRYRLFKENFAFDSKTLNEVTDFAIYKRKLLND